MGTVRSSPFNNRKISTGNQLAEVGTHAHHGSADPPRPPAALCLGALLLASVPALVFFWGQAESLWATHTLQAHIAFWVIGLFTVFFTAMYLFRGIVTLFHPSELLRPHLFSARHVAGVVAHEAYRTRFVLVRDTAPYRLRLSWYDHGDDLLPGDCLTGAFKLDTPHGSANPGTFDYEAWLWRERIDATGYIRHATFCAAGTTWSPSTLVFTPVSMDPNAPAITSPTTASTRNPPTTPSSQYPVRSAIS